MTFREYYKLTRETTNSCIKICGVIFTSIYAVIAIITGYRNESFSDSIEIFLICFLLGNGFGLFIWFLAIISAHGQVKAMTKFYDYIPKEIKDRFGLSLVARPQNPKYNYLQLEILDTTSKQPYLFNFDKKYVWIAIINDLSTIDNFQKRMIDIQKRYKKEQIVLTGWGLRKNIKRKEWKMITYEKVDMILEELKTISNKENLIIINRD
jgi:hypothetical protein